MKPFCATVDYFPVLGLTTEGRPARPYLPGDIRGRVFEFPVAVI